MTDNGSLGLVDTDIVRLFTADDPLVLASGSGWQLPVGIAVVAGVSIMIGQSLVLALNHVGFRRGALTLIASGLGMVLVGLVEALMVWLAARIVLAAAPGVGALLPGVLIAFAPGIALFVFVLALNLVGDGLRDFSDPRASGTGGR